MVSKLKQLKNSESGIAHLALMLVIVAGVGVVGFVGYNIWQKNSSSAASSGIVVSKCSSKGFSSKSQTTLRLNGTTDKGYVRVYYKGSSNKTDWCAVTVKTGTSGSKTPTYVSIKAADGTGYAKNSGNYYSNTSGVIVYDDKCVKVYGHIEYKKKRYKTKGTSVQICKASGSGVYFP